MTRRVTADRRKRIRSEVIASMEGLSDHELKNLRHELGREMGRVSKQQNELRIRLDAIKLEIERRATMTPKGIHISDHAVIRYLERIKGVDVAKARAEIADMAIRAKREAEGRNGRRLDRDTGITLGVDEELTVVTTVFTESELPVMRVE